MARYTCSFLVGLPEPEMIASLKTIIADCDLSLTYATGGYVMAKEKPGNVSFTKLVELEVLFDPNKLQDGKLQVDFVAKNEELPLQNNNHCRVIFDSIQSTASAQQNWQVKSDRLD